MSTTERDLIQLATRTLTQPELHVWLTKHVAGKGRRTGSLALAITENQWRYRICNAERKLATARKDAQ